MKRFAQLLDGLVFTPSRNAKIARLVDYFAHVPDPDRGYALAAIAGTLDLPAAKPAAIRALIAERSDPHLFALSYDYVGDLAETVALLWPGRSGGRNDATLGTIVERLGGTPKGLLPGLISDTLDSLDATERWAFLKLITGGLRIGVSARLAKLALAAFGGRTAEAIEEVWHGLAPPYETLFAWLEGAAGRPEIDERVTFRPLMLAVPLDEAALDDLDPAAYLAEWKWDGARVQIAARDGQARLYSRSGDDIGAAFPDIVDAIDFEAVIDGELLVGADGEPAPFNELQQRLNRKSVGPKMLAERPAFIRAYDILFDGALDLRPLSLSDRRARLEAWFARENPARIDLSPVIPFARWAELSELREASRHRGIEGLMVKRAASPYLQGRPKGHWFKWKRGALNVDCVLMYAQRGHGKRSSFYSDYTFGVWKGDVLVPVGKAYFGFTDEELRDLDAWVRNNTTERFGPVRQVSPGLVLEIAFDSVHASSRHKSGLAMRFPRVHRIRWDKPAGEAGVLAELEALKET